MNPRNFLLAATAALALTGAGRGALYKCQGADGHVVLRDRHCLPGEKVVEEVRSSAVPRQFTMTNTLPAEPPADAGRKKSATTPTSATRP
jgi:hypothetical protein